MNEVRRNPVVLLHGIWDTGGIFRSMATYLRNLGWTVYTVDLVPNNGAVGLDQLAQQVADYIDQALPADAALDLVGFSMGGIVGRYYVQRLGGMQRVQRFITLSSPHNGTLTAYGSRQPGCVHMRQTSAFLQDLNRDIHRLEQLNFTSVWTPLDAMILPASSSRVSVGREVKVQVPLHYLMVSDPKILMVVTEALSEPLRNGGDREA
jgi:triacylglycerol lipase